MHFTSNIKHGEHFFEKGDIFNVWDDEGWEESDIKEDFDPDRTSLTLKFIKKQGTIRKKSGCIYRRIKQRKPEILQNCWFLSMARVREILSVMDDVETIGRNKTRTYRLRKEFFKK